MRTVLFWRSQAKEVQRTVGDLKLSKTSCLDGLPVEFYKTQNELPGPVLHAVYCGALEAHVLPKSLLQSNTDFILKSKNPDSLKSSKALSNWNLYYGV